MTLQMMQLPSLHIGNSEKVAHLSVGEAASLMSVIQCRPYFADILS